VPRAAARDSNEQGDDDLCGVNQPGSCAYANQYSAADIGIPSCAVSEGEEFASTVVGEQGITKEILGAASMGEGIQGSIAWECDR